VSVRKNVVANSREAKSAPPNPANAISTLSRQLEAWPATPLLHRSHSHSHPLVCHTIFLRSTSCVPKPHLLQTAPLYTQQHLGNTRHSKAPLFDCCPLTVICHDKTVTLPEIYETHDQVLRTTRNTRYSRQTSILAATCPTPTSSAGRSRL
jgi:hypothetical protein